MKKSLSASIAAILMLSLSVTAFAAGQMPQTGGIGTKIFYVVGGILVAVAVVVLFARSRMK